MEFFLLLNKLGSFELSITTGIDNYVKKQIERKIIVDISSEHTFCAMFIGQPPMCIASKANGSFFGMEVHKNF